MDANDKIEQGKGRLQQAAGDLTGDEQMSQEGEETENKAKVSETIADVRDKATSALDALRDKVKSD